MAAKRLGMRTIKRLLELRFQERLSQRQTAKALNVVVGEPYNVTKHLLLRKGGSTSVPFKTCQREEVLCHLGVHSTDLSHSLRKSKESLPGFSQMYLELSRKHVTLALLWEEYIEENPRGLSILSLL